MAEETRPEDTFPESDEDIGIEEERIEKIYKELIAHKIEPSKLRERMWGALQMLDEGVEKNKAEIVRIYEQGEAAQEKIAALGLSEEEIAYFKLGKLLESWTDFEQTTQERLGYAGTRIDTLKRELEAAAEVKGELLPRMGVKFMGGHFIVEKIDEAKGKVIMKDSEGKAKTFKLSTVIDLGEIQLSEGMLQSVSLNLDSLVFRLESLDDNRHALHEGIGELIAKDDSESLEKFFREILAKDKIPGDIQKEVVDRVVGSLRQEIDRRIEEMAQSKVMWDRVIGSGKWSAAIIGSAALAGVFTGGAAAPFAAGAAIGAVKLGRAIDTRAQRKGGWRAMFKGGEAKADAQEDNITRLREGARVKLLKEFQIRSGEKEGLLTTKGYGDVVGGFDIFRGQVVASIMVNAAHAAGSEKIRELGLHFAEDPENKKTIEELMPEYLQNAAVHVEALGIKFDKKAKKQRMIRALALSQLRSVQREARLVKEMEEYQDPQHPIAQKLDEMHELYTRMFGTALAEKVQTAETGTGALKCALAYGGLGGAISVGLRFASEITPGVRGVLGGLGGYGLGKAINEWLDKRKAKNFLEKVIKEKIVAWQAQCSQYEQASEKKVLSSVEVQGLAEVEIELKNLRNLAQIPEMNIGPIIGDQVEVLLRRIERLKVQSWQSERRAFRAGLREMIPAESFKEPEVVEIMGKLEEYELKPFSDIPNVTSRDKWKLEKTSDKKRLFGLYKLESGKSTQLVTIVYDENDTFQIYGEKEKRKRKTRQKYFKSSKNLLDRVAMARREEEDLSDEEDEIMRELNASTRADAWRRTGTLALSVAAGIGAGLYFAGKAEAKADTEGQAGIVAPEEKELPADEDPYGPFDETVTTIEDPIIEAPDNKQASHSPYPREDNTFTFQKVLSEEREFYVNPEYLDSPQTPAYDTHSGEIIGYYYPSKMELDTSTEALKTIHEKGLGKIYFIGEEVKAPVTTVVREEPTYRGSRDSEFRALPRRIESSADESLRKIDLHRAGVTSDGAAYYLPSAESEPGLLPAFSEDGKVIGVYDSTTRVVDISDDAVARVRAEGFDDYLPPEPDKVTVDPASLVPESPFHSASGREYNYSLDGKPLTLGEDNKLYFIESDGTRDVRGGLVLQERYSEVLNRKQLEWQAAHPDQAMPREIEPYTDQFLNGLNVYDIEELLGESRRDLLDAMNGSNPDPEEIEALIRRREHLASYYGRRTDSEMAAGAFDSMPDKDLKGFLAMTHQEEFEHYQELTARGNGSALGTILGDPGSDAAENIEWQKTREFIVRQSHGARDVTPRIMHQAAEPQIRDEVAWRVNYGFDEHIDTDTIIRQLRETEDISIRAHYEELRCLSPEHLIVLAKQSRDELIALMEDPAATPGDIYKALEIRSTIVAAHNRQIHELHPGRYTGDLYRYVDPKVEIGFVGWSPGTEISKGDAATLARRIHAERMNPDNPWGDVRKVMEDANLYWLPQR